MPDKETSSESPVQAPTPAAIAHAVAELRAGRLIGLPTETVYGLAGNALNPDSLALIFETKGRPRFDPLIIHQPNAATAFALAAAVPKAARSLAEAFWPGPLTLVLPKGPAVPDLATSGLPSVALRVPAHPVAREVLRAFGGPLAAPSANRFGRISPTTAQAVYEELGDALRLILDGGPCHVGVESTVIAFDDGRPVLLRAGGIAREAIEDLAGPVRSGPSVLDRPHSPGQLASHYAPGKPLRIVGQAEDVPSAERGHTGLLTFGPVPPPVADAFGAIGQLTPKRDLREAATKFFATLRALDANPAVTAIAATRLPEEGLGLALNDRLSRASA